MNKINCIHKPACNYRKDMRPYLTQDISFQYLGATHYHTSDGCRVGEEHYYCTTLEKNWDE